MSVLDVNALRAETVGCHEVIHLNNAGASLVPDPVLSAMVDYLEAEARRGGYELMETRAADLDRFYVAGAAMLGAKPAELAFATSATEAWTKAVASVDLQPGDRVLVSSAEYQSSVYRLVQLRHQGVVVEILPHEANGQVSLDGLEAAVDSRVKLVAVTHIPTQGGLVNPVAEIGGVIANSDAIYLVDAAQSVGQMGLSVDEIGCHFLIGTGRKFLRGPRGTGLLYVRSETPGLTDPPVLDGRSARWADDWVYELSPGARRYETFEVNQAAKVGLGVAIEYAMAVGIDAIAQRVQQLREGLQARLAQTPLVELVQFDGPQSGLVTFQVAGRPSELVAKTLRAWGVNTSLVDHIPPGFDPGGRHSQRLIRASVHYYNTEEELDLAVAAL